MILPAKGAGMNMVLRLFLLVVLLTSVMDAKSILYKVSSPTSTVYILGSIHLAKPELYPLKKPIEEAYGKSDVLVVELDPNSQHSMQVIQSSMMTLGMYKPGKSLKSELTPKTYRLLSDYLKKTGLSLDIMQPMRPWTVMLQLSVMEMMRLGYDPNLGIDQHFLQKAKGEGKPVLEIESAEEQMALLSKEDKTFQDLLLRYTIEEMHEMEPLLNEMFRSWKTGDAKGLAKVVDSSLVVDPRLKEIYEELITKRNYKMTKKIASYLKTAKTYFVVVGAGHVVGDEGIVDLLKRRGFKVTQQ
jgi:hypothetical protein